MTGNTEVTPDAIEPLDAPWRELWRFKALDSTQRLASRLAAAGQELAGVAIWAENQTAGHGRQGRQWDSGAGGLYVTACLPTPWTAEARWIGWTPLIGAMACAGVIRERWGVPAMIKWPNDVLVEDRKLVGMIGELALTPGKAITTPRGLVLLGMGVNWANPAGAAGAAGGYAATALSEHVAGLGPDSRETFLRAWLARLAADMAALNADPEPTAQRLREEAEAVLWRRGWTVTLRHTEHGEASGRLIGLTLEAKARLEGPDGTVIETACGQ